MSPEGTKMTVMNIKQRQRLWATQSTINCDGEYCVDPKSNVPWLNEATFQDFLAADGNEFGAPGERAKIAALHSSSALAVNVFDYWRKRDKGPLALALGLARDIESLSFEQKFSTGVRPRSPNLDVILNFAGGGLLAIESKFTEWIGTSGRKALRKAYLPAEPQRWQAVGLIGAQGIAEVCGKNSGFKRLDVPQLLKHMLGLATQKANPEWHLKLIWYRHDEHAAKEMEGEISRFQDMLAEDSGRFSAMTYQDLWGRLGPSLGAEHAGYTSYLEKRYF
jgi:hypothetical protein